MTTFQKEAENLATVDYELRLPLGIPFPTRMTVVRLGDGSLALISPVPIDDKLAERLAGWGPVSFLLAPSALNHLHLGAAQKRYPNARLLGVSALAERQPQLKFDAIDLSAHAALAAELEAEPIAGARKQRSRACLSVLLDSIRGRRLSSSGASHRSCFGYSSSPLKYVYLCKLSS